jgi:hypothetical protein
MDYLLVLALSIFSNIKLWWFLLANSKFMLFYAKKTFNFLIIAVYSHVHWFKEETIIKLKTNPPPPSPTISKCMISKSIRQLKSNMKTRL